MMSIQEMSIGEFGAFVSEYLREQGIDVVLSGGSCVTIYSRNQYQSFDLDFIADKGADRKNIKSALLNLGFTEKNKYFIHPESEYFVEFPSGPLAVGSESVQEVVELDFPTGRLRLLSPTDCVKDRLAAYYHWQDRQCLEQAVLVAADNQIDLAEVERWSTHEGMSDEFKLIKGMLDNSGGFS
ncbi:MAG: hypothetical protein U9Q61_06915 [Thermodesulfobacteriota bacterium]|nr:hypothetical protein [Thermodesulfobacteriota bacterium]